MTEVFVAVTTFAHILYRRLTLRVPEPQLRHSFWRTIVERVTSKLLLHRTILHVSH